MRETSEPQLNHVQLHTLVQHPDDLHTQEINSSGIRVKYLIAVRNNCRGDQGDEKRDNNGAPSLSRSPLGHLLED
ncbi:hypothetical protein NXS19_003649 [Fusarium pseudograminearum]|nr:hypothetical protein NXS19_003649 [Fusarium pseudograminearum]